MQFFSDIMQHRDSILDSLLFFSAEVQNLLSRVFAWLSKAIAADLLLLVLFCVGFVIFRASLVRDVISWFIRSPGNRGDEGSKLSMPVAATMQDVPLNSVSPTLSNVSAFSVESDKDAFGGFDFSETGPRLRCSKLRAQGAGQPPDLPQACTTVVLKNVPTSFMPDSLLAALHECGYFGEIDFLYVPIDFKHRDRNLGFAVMNFNSTDACLKFAAEFHLASACDKLPDAKIQRFLEVSPALIQGFQANIRHLQKSSVLTWLTKFPAWLPQILDGGGLAMPLKAMRSSNRPRRLISRRAAA